MSHETRQTAVEWYAVRVHDIEILLKLGAISITEFYEELTKAVEQAKDTEKEQIDEGYSTGYSEGYKQALDYMTLSIKNQIKSRQNEQQ